jgi:hypothetical protein
MRDTEVVMQTIQYIDQWLGANAAYLPQHVVDFALDLRNMFETGQLGEESVTALLVHSRLSDRSAQAG